MEVFTKVSLREEMTSEKISDAVITEIRTKREIANFSDKHQTASTGQARAVENGDLTSEIARNPFGMSRIG